MIILVLANRQVHICSDNNTKPLPDGRSRTTRVEFIEEADGQWQWTRERYRRDKTGELLSEIDPKPNNDDFT